MKYKNIATLLTIISIASFTFNTYAQVTIGSAVPPTPGSILEIKEYAEDDARAVNGSNSTKGISLPRVTLTSKNNLFPMFAKEDGVNPNSEYITNKANIDAEHTGLIVYNTLDASGLCPGLYVWDGNKWSGLNAPQVKSVTSSIGGINISKGASTPTNITLMNLPVLVTLESPSTCQSIKDITWTTEGPASVRVDEKNIIVTYTGATNIAGGPFAYFIATAGDKSLRFQINVAEDTTPVDPDPEPDPEGPEITPPIIP